jgi:hypothetical protein
MDSQSFSEITFVEVQLEIPQIQFATAGFFPFVFVKPFPNGLEIAILNVPVDVG